ncbi:hypothetical protein [Nocardia thailandica]|uniref:hypothetical protein n=1 Tax=Nocardia thailandica TaxID=257275 RepID=UPI0002E98FBB|nr:hypothetical protein [Nocardia thailandica]
MTTIISRLARLIGGPMDHDYEPYVPRLTDTATTRSEYRLMYRNPQTGEEFHLLADGTNVWAHRKQLLDADYQVVVTRREIHTSAWEVVERAA